ncbi:hypothetical protein F4780DRAFT_215844 [Xylariomycetidae sp. FL0641]|nr:hypothetical protein F4780DRAFT_215844 [Xylariomycetidae sp. FL0641]
MASSARYLAPLLGLTRLARNGPGLGPAPSAVYTTLSLSRAYTNGPSWRSRKKWWAAEGVDQQAAIEGRRLYLGGVQPHEVVALPDGTFESETTELDVIIELAEAGVHNYTNIMMGPKTDWGKNPDHCLVDFRDKQDAENAIPRLNDEFIVLRVVPITRNDKAVPRRARVGSLERRGDSDITPVKSLYVGGLGRAPDHAAHVQEIRDLLRGFGIKSVSERIPDPESPEHAVGDGNHHHCCYVRFKSPRQGGQALVKLDGFVHRDRPLTVRPDTRGDGGADRRARDRRQQQLWCEGEDWWDAGEQDQPLSEKRAEARDFGLVRYIER